jgi:hypothetical protein
MQPTAQGQLTAFQCTEDLSNFKPQNYQAQVLVSLHYCAVRVIGQLSVKESNIPTQVCWTLCLNDHFLHNPVFQCQSQNVRYTGINAA